LSPDKLRNDPTKTIEKNEMRALTYTKENFEQVAIILKKGGVAVFPTDTTYVIGGSIQHPEALNRIFALKERSKEHSLPLLISRPEVALEIAVLQDKDLDLLKKIWPGPYTLILRTKLRLPPGLLGPDGTVALRCPDHGIALDLLRSVGETLAITSSNYSGKPSPRCFEEVPSELLDHVDAALDAGPCPLPDGTAILKVAGRGPIRVREGCVAVEDIERVEDLLKQLGK